MGLAFFCPAPEGAHVSLHVDARRPLGRLRVLHHWVEHVPIVVQRDVDYALLAADEGHVQGRIAAGPFACHRSTQPLVALGGALEDLLLGDGDDVFNGIRRFAASEYRP